MKTPKEIEEHYKETGSVEEYKLDLLQRQLELDCRMPLPREEELIGFSERLMKYIKYAQEKAMEMWKKHMELGLLSDDLGFSCMSCEVSLVAFSDSSLDPIMDEYLDYSLLVFNYFQGAKKPDLFYTEEPDEINSIDLPGEYSGKLKICAGLEKLRETNGIPLCDLVRFTEFRYKIEITYTT